MEENWKTKFLVIGGLIGLLSGIGAAYILIKRAEQENYTPQVSPREGVALGLSLLGVLRLVAGLGEGSK